MFAQQISLCYDCSTSEKTNCPESWIKGYHVLLADLDVELVVVIHYPYVTWFQKSLLYCSVSRMAKPNLHVSKSYFSEIPDLYFLDCHYLIYWKVSKLSLCLAATSLRFQQVWLR